MMRFSCEDLDPFMEVVGRDVAHKSCLELALFLAFVDAETKQNVVCVTGRRVQKRYPQEHCTLHSKPRSKPELNVRKRLNKMAGHP